MTTVVHIEGQYMNGHQYARVVALADPDVVALNDWWSDTVWNETGDGQPGNVGSWHGAIVTDSDIPELIGERYEWMD